MRSASIAIYFVNACLRHVASETLRHELLQKNKISPDLLGSATARVPAENYANLVRDVMQEMDDEVLGYAKQPHKLGCWSTMTELAAKADNLGEALKLLTRFYRLIPWGIDTRISSDNGLACISMAPSTSGESYAPYLYESFLFYIHRTANWLVSRQIPLSAVDFNFEQAPHCREYWYLFLCENIRYQQPVSQIQFSASLLALPIQQSAKAIEQFLEHVNLAMISQAYARKSWQYRVSATLESRLADNPSFDDIARELVLHPHTLRRYLREEGFSYQQIKNRVRCDNAIYQLSSAGKSVEQTAALIGFSEASAFIRAFKTWTGNTPISYKKTS